MHSRTLYNRKSYAKSLNTSLIAVLRTLIWSWTPCSCAHKTHNKAKLARQTLRISLLLRCKCLSLRNKKSKFCSRLIAIFKAKRSWQDTIWTRSSWHSSTKYFTSKNTSSEKSTSPPCCASMVNSAASASQCKKFQKQVYKRDQRHPSPRVSRTHSQQVKSNPQSSRNKRLVTSHP